MVKWNRRQAVPHTGKRGNPCQGACLESRKCTLTRQSNTERKRGKKKWNRAIRNGKAKDFANGGAYRKVWYLWDFPA